MTRLIDAQDTFNVLTDYYHHHTSAQHLALQEALNRVPTVDAEPVRHAKWIGYAGTIGNECSVCGKWIDVLQGTAEMNYCPNCGAYMRGEK
jgi:hypothetical protein